MTAPHVTNLQIQSLLTKKAQGFASYVTNMEGSYIGPLFIHDYSQYADIQCILGFELKILFYLIVLKEEQRKPICAENYPVGTLPAIGRDSALYRRVCVDIYTGLVRIL